MVPDMSGIVHLFKVLCVLAVIGVVFGIWKIVEIALWMYRNLSITWGG